MSLEVVGSLSGAAVAILTVVTLGFRYLAALIRRRLDRLEARVSLPPPVELGGQDSEPDPGPPGEAEAFALLRRQKPPTLAERIIIGSPRRQPKGPA